MDPQQGRKGGRKEEGPSPQPQLADGGKWVIARVGLQEPKIKKIKKCKIMKIILRQVVEQQLGIKYSQVSLMFSQDRDCENNSYEVL